MKEVIADFGSSLIIATFGIGLVVCLIKVLNFVSISL